MIYTICLNTAVDTRIVIPTFHIGNVIRSLSYSEFPAGKAVNVARTLSCLNTPVRLYCFAGKLEADLFSTTVGSNVQAVVTAVDGYTRRNLTIVAPNGSLIAHIQNPGYDISPRDFQELQNGFLNSVKAGDTVVVSGSLPNGCSTETLNVFLQCISESDTRILLDVDPAILREVDSERVYLLKPNRAELLSLAGREIHSPIELAQAALDLLKSKIILLSLGGDGAIWINRDSGLRLIGRTPPLEAGNGDPVGCGDAMLAAVSLGISQGETDEHVLLRMGIAAGYSNLLSVGPGTINADSYHKLIHHVSVSSF